MSSTNRNLFLQQSIPGVSPASHKVLNQPAADYHAQADVQSCSMLKHLLDSPATYMHHLLRRKSISSKSMEFGTLVHTLCLEPHKFFGEVAIYPGAKKSSGTDRDFMEFRQARPGMHVIDEPTHALAKLAVERLNNQPVMGRKFGDFVAEGEPEAGIYYTDPTVGVACRTRVDLLHPEAIFDVKTTAYAHTPAWTRHALSLHYDMQAYMYSLAECLFAGRSTSLPFVFMTVENVEPLSTAARRAGVSLLEEGERKYQHAIAAFKACMDTDSWPCVGGEEVIEITPWQVSNLDRSWISLTAGQGRVNRASAPTPRKGWCSKPRSSPNGVSEAWQEQWRHDPTRTRPEPEHAAHAQSRVPRRDEPGGAVDRVAVADCTERTTGQDRAPAL